MQALLCQTGPSNVDRQKHLWTTVSGTYTQTIAARDEAHLMPLAIKTFTSLAVDLLSDKDSGQVLDVACGPGEPAFSIAAALPCISVTATDFSEGMLAQARTRLASIGLKNVRLAQADAQDLKAYADNTFDLVTMSFALMFVPDPLQALREFHRVLRPGGTVALGVWTEDISHMAFAHYMAAVGQKLQLQADVAGNDMARQGALFARSEAHKSGLREVGFEDINVRDLNHVVTFKTEEDVYEVASGTVLLKPHLDERLAAGDEGVKGSVQQALQEALAEGGYRKDGRVVFEPNINHFITAKKPRA